jgi:hypothetical protein
MKRISLFVVAALAAVFTLSAQAQTTNTNTVATSPTNIVQLLGLPTGLTQVGQAIGTALVDVEPFISNSIVQVDCGALYNSTDTKGKVGCFLDATIPTTQQTAVGFGGAYLDSQWLDANVTLKLGTTVTKLPYIGPVYAWVASGPDYNFKTRSIGAYNFAGFTKQWDISKNWKLLADVGAGDISTVPGTTLMFGLSVNYHW